MTTENKLTLALKEALEDYNEKTISNDEREYLSAVSERAIKMYHIRLLTAFEEMLNGTQSKHVLLSLLREAKEIK